MTPELRKLIDDALKAFENIQILGDASWKSQKAREAEFELKQTLKKLERGQK